MLLDTASLYFRAFFGVPDTVTAPDGTPVNAVRGLLEFIARFASEYRPGELVCCWDNDWRPQWRVDLIESYKAHRVVAEPDVEEVPDQLLAQIPLIRESLDLLGIPVVGVDGYEADDVIGTLTATAAGPVEVVTGDRDLYQLIDDAAGVRVLYTAGGVSKHLVMTEHSVLDKYGVRPQQYVDFATLRGDPSDGLPGVRGVGEKTAAALLQQYGDLAGIRAAAEDPASALKPAVRARLQEGGAYLDVAPKVVAVALDLPLPDLDLRPRPPADLGDFAEAHGLGSSLARAHRALLELAE